MPNLSIYFNNGSYYVTISGLGNYFTSAYYRGVGLSTSPISYGSTYINGNIITIYPSEQNSYDVSFVVHNLPVGTTVYAYAISAYDGRYYPAGECYVQNSGGSTTNRPQEFYWSYTGKVNGTVQYGRDKIAGQEFYLQAAEWNILTQRVNDTRIYKGLQSAYFTSAYQGQQFYSNMYNEVIMSLNELTGFQIPLKNRGDIIRASELNDLKYILNSVNGY